MMWMEIPALAVRQRTSEADCAHLAVRGMDGWERSNNPGPVFKHYGENVWAAVRAHLDAVTEHAAAPVIAKYTGVLGGADIEIFTWTTTFAIMQSIRLDRGPSGPVHP